MKISITLGTRPEIIKMAPVIRELERKSVDFFIIRTGQHYSHNLYRIFCQELELPEPKYDLGVSSGTHAEETGKMLIGIEKILLEEKPDVILVEGDTNSVLAGALAAAKLQVRVGHVEAGLRSYDRTMPEELNRILTDHLSDFLFAPTEKAKDILLGEGVPKWKIFLTGNTIVDAVYQNLDTAQRKSPILDTLRLRKANYFLVTAHRQENVDTKDRMSGILEGLELVHRKFRLPLVYPVHPRTSRRIKEFGLTIPPGVKHIEAIGFLDFLTLEANAALILTDSGGIQEEACILKVPCVTMRDNTERPETLEAGGNILAGTNPGTILDSAEKMLSVPKDWPNPFGDGLAGARIVAAIYETQKAKGQT